MAITSSDILLMLSTTAGSAGNSNTQGNPNSSLGKYVSTTQLTTGANGLFDDISGAENAGAVTDYRCVFVLNNHATLTLTNAVVYLDAQVSGGANVTIAVDNIGPVAKGSGSAQAAQIATETTAPTSVGAFSAPTTAGTGLSLGSIGPGQVRAFWVKRTATASGAQADGVTFGISGETAA